MLGIHLLFRLRNLLNKKTPFEEHRSISGRPILPVGTHRPQRGRLLPQASLQVGGQGRTGPEGSASWTKVLLTSAVTSSLSRGFRNAPRVVLKWPHPLRSPIFTKQFRSFSLGPERVLLAQAMEPESHQGTFRPCQWVEMKMVLPFRGGSAFSLTTRKSRLPLSFFLGPYYSSHSFLVSPLSPCCHHP